MTTSTTTICLSTVRGVKAMPRQQLALAHGELVAREARSHPDLPDDAAKASEANLLMVGDGL